LGEEENHFVRQVRLAAASLRNFKAPASLDVFILIGVGGLLCGLVDFAHQWTVHNRQTVTIDLSPAALPRYAFYSLMRGLIAYSLSLLFSIVYGYWAARDARADGGDLGPPR
jgi:NitT/TauT family transport system permease protein